MYIEVPREWQNVFVVTGVPYIGVHFHAFYYYWAEKYGSLYQGIRYIGVRYIWVPLNAKKFEDSLFRYA